MKIFETSFPKDYRKEEIKQILDLILTGKFCQLVCVPGAGKATILRLLAHNRNLLRFHLKEKEKPIRFIYLNLFELPSYDEVQIAKFLILSLDENAAGNDLLTLTKQLGETINKLANAGQTLILLFDHFDEYQNKLPRTFFQILRSARSVAKYKFSAVFATRRDLQELVDPEILKEFYDFFIGNTVHMKIYDEKATAFMLSQIEEVFKKKIPQNDKEAIIAKTGGHAKLTKVLAEIRLRENIALDAQTLLATPIIRATLFELWLFLTAQEQQTLINIASGKPVEKTDALENLVKFGLLKTSQQFNNLTIQPAYRQAGNFSFTIPLFAEFVRTTIPTITQQKIIYDQNTKEIKKGTNVISDLLSPQEYRLLKFLIENHERIVERDEIIRAVWPDAQIVEGISDEAIDQMVFRLRKKIEDKPNSPKHLITAKGRGFRFQP